MIINRLVVGRVDGEVVLRSTNGGTEVHAPIVRSYEEAIVTLDATVRVNEQLKCSRFVCSIQVEYDNNGATVECKSRDCPRLG